MLALFTFVVGLLGGFAVYHFFFRLSEQDKQLSQSLLKTQHQFKQYQEKVSTYLNHNAELMNRLQDTCDLFHDHILKGSVDLNLDTQKQSLLQPAPHLESVAFEEEYDAPPSPITPPKDYV